MYINKEYYQFQKKYLDGVILCSVIILFVNNHLIIQRRTTLHEDFHAVCVGSCLIDIFFDYFSVLVHYRYGIHRNTGTGKAIAVTAICISFLTFLFMKLFRWKPYIVILLYNIVLNVHHISLYMTHIQTDFYKKWCFNIKSKFM